MGWPTLCELLPLFGAVRARLDNATLCDLLGLPARTLADWHPPARLPAALGVPTTGGRIRFVPRKRHPHGRRFELARWVGDYLFGAGAPTPAWLASTDLATARQRYQRTFAAELLCPLDALLERLQGDYSETALEEVAEDFDVSPITVGARLADHGVIAAYAPPPARRAFPYPV